MNSSSTTCMVQNRTCAACCHAAGRSSPCSPHRPPLWALPRAMGCTIRALWLLRSLARQVATISVTAPSLHLPPKCRLAVPAPNNTVLRWMAAWQSGPQPRLRAHAALPCKPHRPAAVALHATTRRGCERQRTRTEATHEDLQHLLIMQVMMYPHLIPTCLYYSSFHL